MKKTFEEPNMKTFLLSSDDIMNVISTEFISYGIPGETEGEDYPDKF